MDPETKELLRANLEIAKENNALLKKMERSARWNMFFSIFKWVLIIGSALGIYYYFGQMFSNSLGMYDQLLNNGVIQNSTSTQPTLIERVNSLLKL